MPETLFNKVAGLLGRQLMPETLLKKDTLAQVFSYKFYEISKNTFFTEHLWTTVSHVNMMMLICINSINT